MGKNQAGSITFNGTFYNLTGTDGDTIQCSFKEVSGCFQLPIFTLNSVDPVDNQCYKC